MRILSAAGETFGAMKMGTNRLSLATVAEQNHSIKERPII